jgi:hypothetical protein
MYTVTQNSFKNKFQESKMLEKGKKIIPTTSSMNVTKLLQILYKDIPGDRTENTDIKGNENYNNGRDITYFHASFQRQSTASDGEQELNNFVQAAALPCSSFSSSVDVDRK